MVSAKSISETEINYSPLGYGDFNVSNSETNNYLSVNGGYNGGSTTNDNNSSYSSYDYYDDISNSSNNYYNDYSVADSGNSYQDNEPSETSYVGQSYFPDDSYDYSSDYSSSSSSSASGIDWEYSDSWYDDSTGAIWFE